VHRNTQVAQGALTIVAAARPHPHETISGDGWGAVWSAPHICRIAVIDGLGHGPEAAQAAQTALDLLATHPDLAADAAMRACHRALVGTRGAAVSIVLLDLQIGTLTCAGVGNVDARLWQPGREQRLMIQRGIVGANLPTIRPTSRSATSGASCCTPMASATASTSQHSRSFRPTNPRRWSMLSSIGTVGLPTMPRLSSLAPAPPDRRFALAPMNRRSERAAE
jgi:hypothetical protein